MEEDQKYKKNCDPRFKANTVLGNKIKTMKMLKIIEKAKIISSIPVTDEIRERCITYYAKGVCMSKINHAYDHKPLSETVNADMFAHVSDKYR